MRISANSTEQTRPDQIDVTVCATVSLNEAAEVLGIHRSTAWELHKRGEFPIPVLQIGHRLRVAKVNLEHFLLTGKSGPTFTEMA